MNTSLQLLNSTFVYLTTPEMSTFLSASSAKFVYLTTPEMRTLTIQDTLIVTLNLYT